MASSLPADAALLLLRKGGDSPEYEQARLCIYQSVDIPRGGHVPQTTSLGGFALIGSGVRTAARSTLVYTGRIRGDCNCACSVTRHTDLEYCCIELGGQS